jgi:FixJ family two-component response regulator
VVVKVSTLPKVPLIAIVDDDPDVRQALGDLLHVAGLSARTYDGAAAFFDDYAPGRFDLVVTDLAMPGTDGIELLHRLRAMDDEIMAIVVTSSPDVATRAKAAAEGALACLGKPIDGDALLRLIGTALADERNGRLGT